MDGRPYAVDLRERVVPAVETELWRRVAAAKFEVSISCVVKLLQRWHRRGTVQPDRTGGGKRATLAAHAERVLPLLAAEPDLTIVELRSRLAAAGFTAAAHAQCAEDFLHALQCEERHAAA